MKFKKDKGTQKMGKMCKGCGAANWGAGHMLPLKSKHGLCKKCRGKGRGWTLKRVHPRGGPWAGPHYLS